MKTNLLILCYAVGCLTAFGKSEHSVAENSTENQIIISTTDNDKVFYNTRDVAVSFDFPKGITTVSANNNSWKDIYESTIASIRFSKASSVSIEKELLGTWLSDDIKADDNPMGWAWMKFRWTFYANNEYTGSEWPTSWPTPSTDEDSGRYTIENGILTVWSGNEGDTWWNSYKIKISGNRMEAILIDNYDHDISDYTEAERTYMLTKQ